MIKQFRYPENFEISEMNKNIQQLKDFLTFLDDGTLFKYSGYTNHDMELFLKSLVDEQRSAFGNIQEESWSLVPTDEEMNSEAHVDFVFTPTYLVTSILGRCLCDFPLITLKIPGYYEAFLKGCVFCTYRNFQGHGYEAEEGVIEALRILSLGKVPWLLYQHREFCPELHIAIYAASQGIAHDLVSGNTKCSWGQDLSQKYLSVLELLKTKNGIDFTIQVSKK